VKRRIPSQLNKAPTKWGWKQHCRDSRRPRIDNCKMRTVAFRPSNLSTSLISLNSPAPLPTAGEAYCTISFADVEAERDRGNMASRGGWIGLHTNLNFFCRQTVRVRNFWDYFQNLRTRQPPRIISELLRTVRTEQIWRKLRITWRKQINQILGDT
jgi:hypothetical protein